MVTSLTRMGWRVSATWPTMPLPTGTRVRSASGVWPIWKRMRSSWVRSLSRKMAKMR